MDQIFNRNYKETDFFFVKADKTKLFNKNEIIYSINDDISYLFIILDGEVESVINTNLSKNIQILKKGSVLGLMDIILNRKYSKNMIAKSKVSLALLNKEKIIKSLQINPFQFSLIKSLAIDIDLDKPNVWS